MRKELMQLRKLLTENGVVIPKPTRRGRKDRKESQAGSGSQAASAGSPGGAPAPSPSEEVPGWRTVQSSRPKAWHGEKKKDVLEDGWFSVAVVPSVAQLTGQGGGVCLATMAEAAAAKKELEHCTAAVALLTPRPLDGEGVLLHVPVKDSDGKPRVRERFLVQVGQGNEVTFKAGKPKKEEQDGGGTVRLVLFLSARLSAEDAWRATLASPAVGAKRWLHGRTGVRALDAFAPRLSGPPEDRWIRVLARVPEKDGAKILAASGQDGVFTREFFTADEDRSRFAVVWLPDSSLEAALRQAARVEGSCGVVANSRGFGVRVPRSSAQEATTHLLGPEAAARLGEHKWELTDVPATWAQEKVEQILRGLPWTATVIRPFPCKGRGLTRTWLVQAQMPPPANFVQLADGVVGSLREAMPRKPAANAWSARPMRPAGGPVPQPAWPKAWSQVAKELAKDTASVGIGRGNGAKRTLEPTGMEDAATARPGQEHIPVTALGTPLSTPPDPAASQDMASVIMAAVQAAMAPLQTQMTEMRQDIDAVKVLADPYGESKLIGETDTENSKRSRRA